MFRCSVDDTISWLYPDPISLPRPILCKASGLAIIVGTPNPKENEPSTSLKITFSPQCHTDNTPAVLRGDDTGVV